jgi:hypothetical protein
VSVRCPEGHESATTDYCDECGVPITAAPAAVEPDAVEPDDADEPDTRTSGPAAPPETCPICDTRRSGRDRFCEECGYDFVTQTGGREAPATVDATIVWELTVEADRAYYETLESDGIAFPDHYLPRTFRIDRAETTIGRRHEGRGIHPDVDLSGDPEDTGISRRHAVLVRAADGALTIVDVGSANGTTLNDDDTRLETGTPVAVGDGDRIHLGAWSTITVRAYGRDDAPASP